MATSVLVGDSFRCFRCIIEVSDAARLDATSWRWKQHGPVTACLTCGFVLPARPLPRQARAGIPYGAVLTLSGE